MFAGLLAVGVLLRLFVPSIASGYGLVILAGLAIIATLSMHGSRDALIGGALALALLVPLYTPGLLPIADATLMLALALPAMGQFVVTGVAGQMTLAQGALVGIGAYAFSIAQVRGVPWGVALLLSVTAATLVGTLLALAALRLNELYLAMVTLALVVALPPVLTVAPISDYTNGSQGIVLNSLRLPITRGLDYSGSLYLLVLAFLLAAVAATRNIVESRHGLAMKALALSRVPARISGVSLLRYRLYSFAIAAALAGLGGGLYAVILGVVAPESFDLLFSLSFWVMIVLGGRRRLLGAIIGAALVWWLDVNLTGVNVNISIVHLAILPGAVFGLAIILVSLFLPDGITGLPSYIARRVRASRLAPSNRS